MRKNDPIRKMMSHAPDAVQRGEPLSKVRRLLADHGYNHVPVLDGDKVVGMVSSQDLLRVCFDTDGVDSRAVDAILDHRFSIENLMSTDLVTVSPQAPVREAAELLAGGKVHSVLVVDETRKLEGIVTSTDMIRYLVSQY